MSEESGDLTPIKPERVAQELAKFHALRQTGGLKQDVLDQKFARIVQELRARRIDGTAIALVRRPAHPFSSRRSKLAKSPSDPLAANSSGAKIGGP